MELISAHNDGSGVTFSATGGGGDAPQTPPQQASASDRTTYEPLGGAQQSTPQAPKPQPKPTPQPPQQTGGGETQPVSGMGAREPGSLVYNGQPLKTRDGRPNPLMVGQNIVGRADASSPANMQIPTHDMYCSRQQAIITVLRMDNGSLRTFIRNYMNKNKTWINGKELGKGEEVVIKNGDRIKMGDTTVVFVEH